MNEEDKSIRNLDFAAWRNDLAWMEDMRDSAWQHVLTEEKKRFSKAIRPLQTTISQVQHELEEGRLEERDGGFKAAEGEVLILPLNTISLRWKLAKEGQRWHVANDLAAKPGGHVWVIRDTGKGSEDYQLEYLRNGKRIWKKSKVGPQVVVIGERCYYLDADVLWYNRLCSVAADTGTDRRIHFEQKDSEWNLELLRVQGGQAVLRANRAGKQSLWDVPESGMSRRLWEDGESFVPITATSAFVRIQGKKYYVLRGPLVKSFRMPDFRQHIPQMFHLATATLITRRYGIRTLWKCSGNAQAQRIQTFIGDVEPDPWTGNSFFFTCPGIRPFFGPPDTRPRDESRYAQAHYHTARSRDGVKIPYVLVLPNTKNIHGLLVQAYGAYGLPSSMNTQRWKSLLERGWAMAIALIRGGGDHNDAWAEAARRDQKIKSVEDLEACILSAQEKTKQSAKTTVLFGRSAGGYTVGAVLNRHPKGDLIGAVYTEVPYVDVLKTTTNPHLPLTRLEYEEFGSPAKRLANFATVLRLSPVDGVPQDGIPNVFVLCRTGTKDKEVYTYESVKWIHRLRSAPPSAAKLLAVSEGEGHFPSSKQIYRQRAEDLALLLQWLGGIQKSDQSGQKKSQLQIYNMPGLTRKNRKTVSRKNRRTNRKTRRTNRKSRRTNRK